MSKRAEDYIPRDVQEAAEAAGLSSTPHWYVGRSNGHEHKKLAEGLGAVVKKAREDAELAPPTLVDPPTDLPAAS
jgi:hypothetical protein